jgi:hypothetical protein
MATWIYNSRRIEFWVTLGRRGVCIGDWGNTSWNGGWIPDPSVVRCHQSFAQQCYGL